MARVGERKSITVREILEICPAFWIPHFQRGMIWRNDSVSALLESLFLETHCGSFVFWKSRDKIQNGIPLIAGSEKPIEHLIVDGQQRIRSLNDVLHNVDEDHVDNGAPENIQNDGCSGAP